MHKYTSLINQEATLKLETLKKYLFYGLLVFFRYDDNQQKFALNTIKQYSRCCTEAGTFTFEYDHDMLAKQM